MTDQLVEYKNSFAGKDSPAVLTTTAKPVHYKGYLIYERIKGTEWDIVKDGVCVGMYAGPTGARRAIDTRLNLAWLGEQLSLL